ncbi:unnamed protein product [Cylicocyclus nassatus]|uniref:Uncharacterized protein n=1 Tax=Cylicocyclus nassatus TaxID=53992 RepID=A0AA36GSP1_CYLNA|nr:unnamed protein product [Cylicocyclus nassatus]
MNFLFFFFLLGACILTLTNGDKSGWTVTCCIKCHPRSKYLDYLRREKGESIILLMLKCKNWTNVCREVLENPDVCIGTKQLLDE